MVLTPGRLIRTALAISLSSYLSGTPFFGPDRDERPGGEPSGRTLYLPILCRLGRDQSVADGEAHQPRDIVDVEALHDLCAVRLDRLDAEEQALGDLTRGMA